MVDHLRDIGCKAIVHIAGPDDNIDAEQRVDAFRRAIRKTYPDGEPLVVSGDYSEESGAGAVRQLLKDGTRFDAIFASNDMMAIGAIEQLREHGLSVPGDVAVAGFDDVPIARHLGITTARIRIDELGGNAIARLVDIIEGGEDFTIQQLYAPELIIRMSTGKS